MNKDDLIKAVQSVRDPISTRKIFIVLAIKNLNEITVESAVNSINEVAQKHPYLNDEKKINEYIEAVKNQSQRKL